jgi:predicted nuclease with TOPRIM domain
MGKAEDKYDFFMKATELERVDRSYASTLDTVMDMEAANDRIKEGLSQKVDQVDILKKKYEEHLEVDKLEDKLEQMAVSYAWAYYNSVDSTHNDYLTVSLNF